MVDITMCTDEDCLASQVCYRYVALPCKFRQSYFVGSPRKPNAPNCEYFIKADKPDTPYTK